MKDFQNEVTNNSIQSKLNLENPNIHIIAAEQDTILIDINACDINKVVRLASDLFVLTVDGQQILIEGYFIDQDQLKSIYFGNEKSTEELLQLALSSEKGIGAIDFLIESVNDNNEQTMCVTPYSELATSTSVSAMAAFLALGIVGSIGVNSSSNENQSKNESNLLFEDQAEIDAAQSKIMSYAEDKNNTTPTVEDYAVLEVTDVTVDNLDTINAKVDALTAKDVDSQAEVQILVDMLVAFDLAQDKIVSYANDTTMLSPSVEEYEAIGVTGVTVDNLVAVNAKVAELAGDDVDSTIEVQAVVNQQVQEQVTEEIQPESDYEVGAFDVAMIKIVAFAEDSRNPTPTVDDYAAIEVTGVSLDNLSVINGKVDALVGDDVDTQIEIQTLVEQQPLEQDQVTTKTEQATTEAAQAMAEAAQATAETAQATAEAEQATAEAEQATAEAEQATAEAEQATAEAEQATAEAAQAAFDTALDKIVAYAEDTTSPAPTVEDYVAIEVAGVTVDNLAAVNAKVDAEVGIDVDTTVEVQAVVDEQAQEQAAAEATQAAIDAAQAKIVAYAEDTTSPAPTVEDYVAIEVAGVTVDNLAEVNAKVDALIGDEVDTEVEVQALVDQQAQEQAAAEATQAAFDTALAKIVAYANDSANPAPTVEDYVAIEVAGVTVDNLAAVNAKVDAEVGIDVDTTVEVQAEVDEQAQEQATADAAQAAFDTALAKIVAYANDSANPAPTVEDYVAIEVAGVTVDNLAAVNAKVDAEVDIEVDTTVEVQAVVDEQAQEQTTAEAAQAAFDTALAKIVAYANDSANPAPTVEDYVAIEVAGVTVDNLAAVNAKVDALVGGEVDTTVEVQAVVDEQAQEQTTAEAAQAAFDTALAKIVAYANDSANPTPTVEDYVAIEVAGVTVDNLAAVNAKVDALVGGEVDTTVEVQAVVDEQAQEQTTAEAAQAAFDTALAKIVAYANDSANPAPTVEDYVAIEVAGVTVDNLAAVNAKVDALIGDEVDTEVEVQALVDQQAQAAAEAAQASFDTALAKIVAYADDNTNPQPTLDDYTAIDVTGVTADNLAAINAKVDALIGDEVDTEVEVQALVDQQAQEQAAAEAAQVSFDTALAKIVAYAEDNTNPASTVADYVAIDVTGVTADNLAEVNAKVDVLIGNEVDTTVEVQALVDQQAQEQAAAEAAQASFDTALAKIVAYAEDNTNPTPTVADYVAIDVTGVSADNLAAINAKVDTLIGDEVDSTVEVQALVDQQAQEQAAAEAAQAAIDAAQAKIVAYAEDNTNPAPTVEDYAAIGVTGVTADNLDAVNAKVDALVGEDVDTTVEVQALVDQQAQEQAAADAAQAAIDAAQAKIVAYAEDNTNPAPTVEDYAAIGVTGVTADNLDAVNAKVDALVGEDVDTTVEVQALVDQQAQEQAAADAAQAAIDAAQGKIVAYAEDNTNSAPNLDDYAAIGVTGVTAENLDTVNAKVDALVGEEVDTTVEVQALVDQQAQEQAAAEATQAAIDAAQAKIVAYAEDNTNPAPTVEDYAAIGVTGITAENLDAVNAKVDALVGEEVDTTVEVQALVDQQAQEQAAAEAAQAAIDAAQAKIVAYAEDNTNSAPNLDDYAAIGVTAVTAENLDAVNAKVDALVGEDVDTQAEVQALVDQQAQAAAEAAQAAIDAAQGKIVAYAEDNTNSAPNLDDYAAIGVTGVTAENLDTVNAKVDALVGEDVDTQAEVQALVDQQEQAAAEAAQAAIDAAQAKIVAYAEDNTNPAPNLDDYAAIGVTAVTAENLDAVNAKVDALVGEDVDTQAEVQALVDQQAQEQAAAEATQAAIDAAQAKIVAYAEDNTNPAPTVEDYAAIGVTGVTAENLDAVNAKVDALVGEEVDTTVEVQALVDQQAQEQAAAEATQAAIDAAQAKIVAYAEDNTNPAPTVEDYAAIGVTGVTADNLDAVNAKVDALVGEEVDTTVEVQALVDQQAQEQAAAEAAQAAIDAAQAKIVAYAEDNTNSAPNLDDYAAIGVTAVTAENLDAVNAKVDALVGEDVDTQAEVQALVDQQAQAAAEAAQAAIDAAIAKIIAYADDNTSPQPTLDDYTAIDVTGVTADNLAAVNAKVDALVGEDVDTQAEIQALVDQQAQEQAAAEATQAAIDAAQAKIVAYAEDNTNPAPTVEDYAAIGVTGVTADNLDAVNAKVDALVGEEVDTTVEVQALVDQQAQEQAAADAAQAAIDAAQAKIVAYAEDNTNPAPNVDDYAAIGVTGVTAENLDAINAKVDTLIGDEVDTTVEVQALVDEQGQEQAAAEAAQASFDAAQAKIVAYAEDNTNPAPTVEDYAAIGVTGVTAENLDAVNAKVDALVGEEVDTQAEVQALVDQQAQEQAAAEAAQASIDAAQAKIVAYAEDNTNPAPTVEDYAAIGVTGVTADNLDAVNAKVDALVGEEVDTTVEVQALVDQQAQEQAAADAAQAAIDAAQAKIVAYAEDNTNPAPNVDDYAAIGVTGVTAENLDAINAKVDTLIGDEVDTTVEVQALVDEQGQEQAAAEAAQASFDTALAKIVAYADDNTNPQPTLDDYTAIDVTGVTADNLAAINAKVDALVGEEVDTQAEVQALVDQQAQEQAAAEAAQASIDAAQAKIVAYAEDNTNPAPTVEDYAAIGVTGVTAENLDAVNAKVDTLVGEDVDTTVEVQALVDQQAAAEAAQAAIDAAQAKIVAYAEDNTNSAPNLDDYAAIGVTGVTADNLDAVNAKVDALVGEDVDTQTEVQALVDQQAQEQAAADAAQAAIDAAQAKIVAYAEDNTNPAPNLDDYAAIGVIGVTAENLDAVNAKVDALVGIDVDTKIEVQNLISVPDSLNKTVTGSEDTIIEITLTGIDLDGDIASFSLTSLPDNGKLFLDNSSGQPTNEVTINTDYNALGGDLTLYFMPNANWTGETKFNYLAQDNNGRVDTSPASVNIEVIQGENDPVDIITAAEGGLLSLEFLGDIDVLGIIDITDQSFVVNDPENSIDLFQIDTNQSVAVSNLIGANSTWDYSIRLAEELGIDVAVVETNIAPSLLPLVLGGSVSSITFTPSDPSSTIDNASLNELLATTDFVTENPLELLDFIGLDALTVGTENLFTATTLGSEEVYTESVAGLLNVGLLNPDKEQLIYEGTDGDDQLNGNESNNRIYGFDGDDTLLGLGGNDLLRGGIGADILDGGGGDDTLIDGIGNGVEGDTLIGGAGKDSIQVSDLSFKSIDGGEDEDTLVLMGEGIEFDLSEADEKIDNIEVIDISGKGDNSLTLTESAVLNITDNDNFIQIDGDVDDSVTLTGAEFTETVALNDTSYDIYQLGAATVYVESEMSVEI